MIAIPKILAFTLLIITCNTVKIAAFLHTPETITSLEYNNLKQHKLYTLVSFTWRAPLFEFNIRHKGELTNFALRIDTELYDQLSDTVKTQFKETTQDKQKFAYIYSYGSAVEQETNTPTGQSHEYYVAKPYTTYGKPQEISVEELAQLIKKQRVVFYTGAGMSAHTVPSMQKLEEMLGFTRDGRGPTITHMVSNPEMVAQNFTCFVRLSIESPTTPAHRALALIAPQVKTSVLTENIDLLHEASGIAPLFAGSQKAHDLCTSENLKEIDLLISIGLSHDDRGFIAQYKHCNPQAKIVALDFNKPDYLDNWDILLQGDIQVTLPLLAHKLSI